MVPPSLVMVTLRGQEVELGKESKYIAEIKKHGQTTEEMKRLQAVGNNLDKNIGAMVRSKKAKKSLQSTLVFC